MAGSGFRDLYGPAGPDAYYRDHGDDYRNPHEAAVVAAVEFAVHQCTRTAEGIDFSNVLDLAAGSGEVTLALARLRPEARITGIDPYTADLYQRRTGRSCQEASFEEIALGTHVLERSSCIVVSFALHLAADSWLPPLCLALAEASGDLLVITPLTRPEIRPEWGWELQEATALTREERKVRLRWYRSRLGREV